MVTPLQRCDARVPCSGLRAQPDDLRKRESALTQPAHAGSRNTWQRTHAGNGHTHMGKTHAHMGIVRMQRRPSLFTQTYALPGASPASPPPGKQQTSSSPPSPSRTYACIICSPFISPHLASLLFPVNLRTGGHDNLRFPPCVPLPSACRCSRRPVHVRRQCTCARGSTQWWMRASCRPPPAWRRCACRAAPAGRRCRRRRHRCSSQSSSSSRMWWRVAKGRAVWQRAAPAKSLVACCRRAARHCSAVRRHRRS
mmetsp:Transcript_39973/g.119040  ORF Transcript_39973/g.119040 Transcript_39973/m.119040 type:complete len:254 (+) Transcript_39973:950-1711(+)